MSENLRLERIRVNKLFNRFNYDIDLNNGFDIGILIAPNGCGKTTIFNLIEFIFNPSLQGYRNIVNIPFDFCECTLSNGNVVKLTRSSFPYEEPKQKEDPKAMLKREISLNKRWRMNKILGNRTEEDVLLDLSVKAPKKGAEIAITSFFSESISDLISNDSSIRRDLGFLSDNYEPPRQLHQGLTRFTKTITEILQDTDCNLNINYIRADRCYRSHGLIDFSEDNRNPLSDIRNSILGLYRTTKKKYDDKIQKIKDDLPKMYLDMKDEEAISFTDFQKGWNKYLSDIKKYCKIGLLPPQDKQNILEVDENTFNNKKEFLTVYLDTFAGKKTLAPLEEFYSRLKLFADILNHRNRITRKVIKYDFDDTLNEHGKGIVFEVDGKNLPLESLSSGEKNDLIMFYHLIFDGYYDLGKKIDLVLVDEPEISLHVEWQREYLDQLLKICETNKLQAFVATHSPNIINGHFALYVERGVTDEQ